MIEPQVGAAASLLADRQQLNSLFLGLIEGSSLIKVDLSYNDLSSVDPETLAQAVNKLESVTLNRTCVTCDQVK